MVPFSSRPSHAADGRGFEDLLGGERVLEMPVNLRKQARQIPGGEILARRFGGCVRCMNRQRFCWKYCQYQCASSVSSTGFISFGRLGDLGFQAHDLLLRLVALDVSFQRDFLADGLGGLGVGLVFQGGGDDGFEVGDGGLRQAMVDGVLHRLPLRVARARNGESLQCDGEHKPPELDQAAVHANHHSPFARIANKKLSERDGGRCRKQPVAPVAR